MLSELLSCNYLPTTIPYSRVTADYFCGDPLCYTLWDEYGPTMMTKLYGKGATLQMPDYVDQDWAHHEEYPNHIDG